VPHRTTQRPGRRQTKGNDAVNRQSEIFLATEARCIEEQNEQRTSAFCAMRYRDEKGLLGRAAQEQREAAYHYGQAWTRLARLIGAA
jgi:hypothetical protein